MFRIILKECFLSKEMTENFLFSQPVPDRGLDSLFSSSDSHSNAGDTISESSFDSSDNNYLFKCEIDGNSTFKHLIDYISKLHAEVTMLFSEDFIIISEVTSNEMIMNEITMKRAHFLSYEYNTTRKNFKLGLSLRELKGAVKQTKINIVLAVTNSLDLVIETLSKNTRNSAFVEIKCKNVRVNRINPPEYSTSEATPSFAIDPDELKTECDKFCANISSPTKGSAKVKIQTYTRGMTMQYSSGATNLASSFGQMPDQMEIIVINGITNIIASEFPVHQGIELSVTDMKALAKLKSITSKEKIFVFAEKEKPLKLMMPIKNLGELRIFIRSSIMEETQ